MAAAERRKTGNVLEIMRGDATERDSRGQDYILYIPHASGPFLPLGFRVF